MDKNGNFSPNHYTIPMAIQETTASLTTHFQIDFEVICRHTKNMKKISSYAEKIADNKTM